MVLEICFVILFFQSNDSEILNKKEIGKNTLGMAGQLEISLP